MPKANTTTLEAPPPAPALPPPPPKAVPMPVSEHLPAAGAVPAHMTPQADTVTAPPDAPNDDKGIETAFKKLLDTHGDDAISAPVQDEPVKPKAKEEAKPKDEAKPTAEPTVATAEATPGADALLELAEVYGLTRAEAESLGDKLPTALKVLAKRSLAPQVESAQEPEPEPEAEPAKPLIADEVLDKFDDDTKAVFKTLMGTVTTQAQELKALKGQSAQVQTAQQAQQNQALIKSFDDGLSTLAKELPATKALLGEDSYATVARNSPEFANRQKLVRAMDIIAAGCERNGDPVPAFADLQRQAAFMAFGEALVKSEKQAVIQEVRTAAGRFTTRPNGRAQSHQPTTEEDKDAVVAAKLAAHPFFKES